MRVGLLLLMLTFGEGSGVCALLEASEHLRASAPQRRIARLTPLPTPLPTRLPTRLSTIRAPIVRWRRRFGIVRHQLCEPCEVFEGALGVADGDGGARFEHHRRTLRSLRHLHRIDHLVVQDDG